MPSLFINIYVILSDLIIVVRMHNYLIAAYFTFLCIKLTSHFTFLKQQVKSIKLLHTQKLIFVSKDGRLLKIHLSRRSYFDRGKVCLIK